MANRPEFERVLALEQRPSLRMSLEAVAESEGLVIDTVETDVEARALLAQGGYGVVLVDVADEGCPGTALLRHIRERGWDVHVVVVTNNPSQQAAVSAMRLGANDFLRKPYSPEELLLTLRNALENRRQAWKEPSYQRPLEGAEEGLYRFMVERSPDVVYVLDSRGNFSYLNPAVEKMLGYVPESLIGRHYSAIVAQKDQETVSRLIDGKRELESSGRQVRVSLRGVRGESQIEHEVAVELTAMGIYSGHDSDEPGRFMGTYGVARDVTSRQMAEEAILFQAHHDPLTGLPNRMLLRDQLTMALANARRAGTSLAVLFLDLDGFKLVNDSLGHDFGDRLLQAVAKRLRACLREGDFLARLGGDEFTVLLPSIERIDQAVTVARKFVREMEEPFTLEGNEIHLGVSIGIAEAPLHGNDVDTLIKHADVAMYQAKDAGRGGWALYSPPADTEVAQGFDMEAGLREALARNRLSVVYQPQVDLATRRVSAMEALLRWEHPGVGMISPREFIPLAERTGLIIPIGQWLLRTACSQMKEWMESGGETLRLSINLSPVQLEQPEFVDDLIGILAETGFPASLLELEITERVFMHDIDGVAAKMRRLTRLGVGFVVDDFGTGHSSLSYLQRLPVHALKIDKSFINGLDKGSELVGAIVAMGQSMGLKVVAEGVETAEQASALQRLRCKDMQGFYFSRPAALEAAASPRIEPLRSVAEC